MSKIVMSVYSSIVLSLETAVLMFYCFITGCIIISAINGLIQYCSDANQKRKLVSYVRVGGLN